MSVEKFAPPPWTLKGRSWSFVLSGISKTANFPAGFAASHEAEVMTSGGEFVGGQGLIMLVSYSESPVGPYDELMYVPGKWKYADGSSGFRITRIYVSSKESTENGRRNWNIPKQVAKFDITAGRNGSTIFAVSHLNSPSPFFKVTLKPISVLSSLPLPINSRWLGAYCSLMQPPLPVGDQAEEVATDKWAMLTPGMKGTARLVSIVPGVDGKISDGIAFPAVEPWSIGGYVDKLDLNFGEPTLFDSVA